MISSLLFESEQVWARRCKTIYFQANFVEISLLNFNTIWCTGAMSIIISHSRLLAVFCFDENQTEKAGSKPHALSHQASLTNKQTISNKTNQQEFWLIVSLYERSSGFCGKLSACLCLNQDTIIHLACVNG